MPTHSLTYRQPFVVDSEILRRIDRLVAADFGSPRYEASCGDKIERTFDNVEQLLAYPNAASSEVQTLKLLARDPSKGHMSVELDTDDASRIHVYASGPDEVVQRVAAGMRDEVKHCRPLYWFIAQTDMFLVVVGVLVLLFGWASVSIVLQGRTTNVSPTADTGYANAVMFLFTGALFVASWLLNIVRRALFPRGVIAFGHAAAREKRRDFFRIVVVLGVILGVVSSLIATVIYSGPTN